MSKYKRKIKNLKIPIYFGGLKIIQVKELGELNKEYDVDLYGLMGAFMYQNDSEGYASYTLAFPEDVTPSVIAHESLHLTNQILNDSGVRLDPDNDEPQCYLIGWIVNECHKFLKIKP